MIPPKLTGRCLNDGVSRGRLKETQNPTPLKLYTRVPFASPASESDLLSRGDQTQRARTMDGLLDRTVGDQKKRKEKNGPLHLFQGMSMSEFDTSSRRLLDLNS